MPKRKRRAFEYWMLEKLEEKGELYNVIIDHIKSKLFSGKTLSEAKKEEIEMVLDNLEEIRKNFTQPIVEGILGGKKNGN